MYVSITSLMILGIWIFSKTDFGSVSISKRICKTAFHCFSISKLLRPGKHALRRFYRRVLSTYESVSALHFMKQAL